MFLASFSLEEEAARRDAVGLASKPDLAPLTLVSPLIGPGMLQPAAGLESTLYLPVERQEQVALANLAVAFGRLDLDSPTAEETPIVTDVAVVLSVGSAPPVMMHLGPLYARVDVDLLASGDGAAAEHAYLCLKTEKAGLCTEAPLVDLAVVYGGAADGGGGARVYVAPERLRRPRLAEYTHRLEKAVLSLSLPISSPCLHPRPLLYVSIAPPDAYRTRCRRV